jgi:hypothetical protein
VAVHLVRTLSDARLVAETRTSIDLWPAVTRIPKRLRCTDRLDVKERQDMRCEQHRAEARLGQHRLPGCRTTKMQMACQTAHNGRPYTLAGLGEI